MSTLEVGVELLVTGALMLAALLLPAFGIWYSNLPDGDGALALLGTIAAGVALGLGVVVDRCADSLLSSWEAGLRVSHAWRDGIARSRKILLDGATVTDCYPEDWMRLTALAAEEGVVRWLDQLRVRIRIARTIGILAPALATSGLLALSNAPWWSGVLHLAALWLVFQFDFFDRIKGPKTDGKEALSGAPGRVSWLLRSPASAWLALQGIAAVVLVATLVEPERGYGYPVAAGGALLTLLALQVWARVQSSFHAYLWNTCLVADREGLRARCTSPRTSDEKGGGA